MNMFNSLSDKGSIQNIFKSIVAAMNVAGHTCYYQFGYWLEVQNQLALKRTKEGEQQKYPLVILSPDFEQKKGTDIRFSAEINPKIYIAALSLNSYTAEERYTNIYQPILDPLYNSFIEELSECSYFDRYNKNEHAVIPHVRKDLYYLSVGKAGQNILPDVLDAIEISFNSLKIYKT